MPNAVALAATPLLAAAPAPRHVPVPATAYVIPVAALMPTTVHRPCALTARSPLGSKTRWLDVPMLAVVAATPRYAPDEAPVPANVVITPVAVSNRRTRRPASSTTYSHDPSTSVCCGKFTVAALPCPPSPVDDAAPVPTTVRMLHTLAGLGDREGERVVVGVSVAVGE
jgi:hypothetical protein